MLTKNGDVISTKERNITDDLIFNFTVLNENDVTSLSHQSMENRIVIPIDTSGFKASAVKHPDIIRVQVQ